MEQVKVWRGRHGDPVPLFGPLPGVRLDDTLAYEYELAPRLTSWPGRTRIDRSFVLLDLGVSMALPAWRPRHGPDRDKSEPDTWYVDLVHVTSGPDSIIVRDLYIDVLVPVDGRHQRLLDLDEFADAIEAGQLDVGTAIDGLRRWQRFLDRHLHAARDPARTAAGARRAPCPAGPDPHRARLILQLGPRGHHAGAESAFPGSLSARLSVPLAQEALPSLWHHPCWSLTAWLPQPCRWSCMNEASMQYERAGGGRGRRIRGHDSFLVTHGRQK